MRADGAYEPVLRALLAQLGRARDTPLQFGLDGRPLIPVSATGATGLDWPTVLAQFDALIAVRLAPDPEDAPAAAAVPDPAARDTNTVGPHDGHPLEVWIDRLRALAQTVQPQAIAILALRVDGFSNRDTARRLGLGHRMVRATVAELRAQWPGARTTHEA